MWSTKHKRIFYWVVQQGSVLFINSHVKTALTDKLHPQLSTTILKKYTTL